MVMESFIEKCNKKCRICNAQEWILLYKGPIRMGKSGDYSKDSHIVWKCKKCKVAFLDRSAINYEMSEYRRMVDGSVSIQSFYALHDNEQADKINILGTGGLREKVVADIGSGAGSFLDLLKGYAATTIAVEPALNFQKELKRKGHEVYSYTKYALKDWRRKVDVAVCFAVLEHIEFPLEFLKEIRLLLKPGGILILSTPNRGDWMLQFLSQGYGRFFYRYVHTWYFDKKSLEKIGKLAGFRKVEISYSQRFDISNALLWARDLKPTGLGKFGTLSELDSQYKRSLESKGRSDFIYARFFT